jgi:hypothetical protein
MGRVPNERDYNRLFGSRYLSKDDVPEPVRTTITDVRLEDVRERDNTTISKYAVAFADFDKVMLLNVTNARTLSSELGKDASNWKGAEIEIYNDLSVSYGGVQGGLRLRVLSGKPVPRKSPGPASGPDMNDSIPF